VKNENSKDNWASYRSSLTVSGPQQMHWAAGRAKESLKLKSELCPLLQKQRFQRRDKGAVGKIPSREEQESVREFDNPRSRSGQEARFVCGCESEDFKSNKGTMGKV